MALQTARIPTAVGKKLAQGSGRRTVSWRDSRGQRFDAIVMGPGSSSGAKLLIPEKGAILDNVAKATSRTQTNVYMTTLP